MKTVALALFALLLGADFVIPPVPQQYVTDSAGALSPGTRDALDSELRQYEATTGHQVIVWIGQTTGDVPLETWTGETADHWKVGRKGRDDGAVLFLFMQDHKARIEVGYGLEGALPDADAYRIIQDVIRPKMRSGDVDGAVSGGVAAMITTITPSYRGVTPPPETMAMPANAATEILLKLLKIAFIIALALLFQALFGRRRRGYFIGSGLGGGLFSGGGFGGGGGGFSAGGGGFGGGGASGGW